MTRQARHCKAVVIGCSTGGLQALMAVLPGLAPDLPVPVVLVCHTGAEDVDLLCDLLGRSCPLPVREAEERQQAQPGVVHVAPSGYHLYLERDRSFTLSIDPKVCYVRPAVDVLFESAADVWKSSLLGIVLTGANDDGAAGLARIRKAGGYGIVQNPAEAVAAQMPQAALRTAGADEILSLREIAERINELCS